MSIRFDSIKMPKVTKTAEGYLRGEVVASRAGVFKYRNADGSIRGELRHPDNVFKKESLETLKMIPMTDNHPPEFVNSTNAHKYQVGYTGEHYDVSEGKIIVSFTVTHQDAIDAILNGKLELSLGYSVDITEEKGSYNNENYDYRQLSPIYNHLAIVDRGRAGSEARFRFDYAAESIEDNEINNNIKEVNMSDNRTENNVENNDSAEVLKVRFDAAIAEKELLKNQLIQSQLKVDALEKSLTKSNEDLANEKKKSNPEVRARETMDRVEMLARSAPYIDIEAYIHHSDRDIMIAAINSNRTDSINFSDKSDEYVKGTFETLIGASYKADKIDTRSVFSVLSSKCDMSSTLTTHDKIMKHMKEGK